MHYKPIDALLVHSSKMAASVSGGDSNYSIDIEIEEPITSKPYKYK